MRARNAGISKEKNTWQEERRHLQHEIRQLREEAVRLREQRAADVADAVQNYRREVLGFDPGTAGRRQAQSERGGNQSAEPVERGWESNANSMKNMPHWQRFGRRSRSSKLLGASRPEQRRKVAGVAGIAVA